MKLQKSFFLLVFIYASAFVLSCTKKDQPADNSPEALLARGKKVYFATCSACHAMDPKKDGSIGPAIWGSSLELVRARVVTAKYPDGYTPKRTTAVMPAMPQLKDDVEALHAFLNAR